MQTGFARTEAILLGARCLRVPQVAVIYLQHGWEPCQACSRTPLGEGLAAEATF